jgi:hypothetical protein
MPGERPVGDLLWGASWGGNVTLGEGLSRHLSALTRTILLQLCYVSPHSNEGGEQAQSSRIEIEPEDTPPKAFLGLLNAAQMSGEGQLYSPTGIGSIVPVPEHGLR